MCGSATLAIVVSIACMIVASMIEIVIATRLTVEATRSGAPLTSCSVRGGRWTRLWVSPVAEASLPAGTGSPPLKLAIDTMHKPGDPGAFVRAGFGRRRQGAAGG